jgi:hypothetical protein
MPEDSWSRFHIEEYYNDRYRNENHFSKMVIEDLFYTIIEEFGDSYNRLLLMMAKSGKFYSTLKQDILRRSRLKRKEKIISKMDFSERAKYLIRTFRP